MKIKALVESIINSSSSLNLVKGKKVFKESIITDVKGKKIEDVYHIYGTVKNDRKVYNTHIRYDLNNNKVLQCNCGCEEFNENYKYKKSFLCEHLVATTLKFNKLVEEKVKMLNVSEKSRNDSFYKENNIDKLMKNAFKEKEKLSLEIFINTIENYDLKYYQVEIKVANKMLYSLNNIKEFIYNILEFKNFKINNDFMYNVENYEFDKNDYDIIFFIKEYLDLNDRINEGMNKKFKIFNGKYLNLLPNNLYRFLNILGNKEITFTKNLITYKTKVLKKNLPLSFTVKEKDNLLLLTTKKNMPIPLNENFNIFLYERNIYIPEINQSMVYKEFHSMLQNKGVIYLKKDLKTYMDVINLLKTISNNINLSESLYRTLGEILKCKFHIEKSFNDIYCYITLLYGKEKIDFFSKDNDVLRNKEKERKIVNALERLKFIKKEDKFLFIGNDYDLYYFLKEGKNILKEFGDVEFLNELENFKLYNSKDIEGELSIKDNKILFEYNFSSLDEFEIKDLINSFKDNKQFFKSKNNRFIDLTDEKVIEFINMVLLLDVKDFNKGKIYIDENKGLYLLNKLKKININITGKDVLEKLYSDLENLNGKVIIPKTLNAKLKPYQEFGVKWLYNIDKLGFGGILADDMGLGKTIQIITFLLLKKKRSMIVVPTSLIYNWTEEFKKFAPSLKVKVVYGDSKKREQILNSEEDYDILLTTYGTLKMDYSYYGTKEFDYLIIDEAQIIKNPKAQITKYIKAINSKVRFALTGTPIENTLLDIWSIFDFLMPGYLETKEEFCDKFKKEENMKNLKDLISPFILRREKIKVLDNLPKKQEQKIMVNMTKKQRLVYNSYVKAIKEAIKNNKGSLFTYLTKLRLICLEPSLVINNYDGGNSKIDALMDIIQNNIEINKKILVFSQFTKVLDAIKAHLENKNINYSYLDGKISSKERLKRVKEFNDEDKNNVFLISLKAGGTGLNLTSANLVIHFDPWWNPAVENQATDRAYRIGQQNDVEVLKLICKDSIEEKIVNLQEDKNSIIDNILDNEIINKNLNNLTKEDILNMLN